MAASVATLRACGGRPVALVTREGTFEGAIDQARLGDGAIMVLLAPVGASSEPVVIALDAIEEILER